MKKALLIFGIILSSIVSQATVHIINVWDGYFQFVDPDTFGSDITIQLGDTVQWLPLDTPSMVHTITSTNIPLGAEAFDQIWQVPADTFFQYIPLIEGLYEYECTPHATSHNMVGSINVLGSTAGIGEDSNFEKEWLVYPNPTVDFIHIQESRYKNFPYQIFSSQGKLILAGETMFLIDVSTLNEGIYTLKIIADQPRSFRFIKQE